MKITKSTNVRISEIVFAHVEDMLANGTYITDENDVDVNMFSNGREVGYTFSLEHKHEGGFKYYTFAVYQHRNSDTIIVNGAEGYRNEMPYLNMGDKYDYYAGFEPNEHYQAAEYLAKALADFSADGSLPAKVRRN